MNMRSNVLSSNGTNYDEFGSIQGGRGEIDCFLVSSCFTDVSDTDLMLCSEMVGWW